MANNIDTLKEDIALMQEFVDDTTETQEDRDAVKETLMEAKKQLAELESDKGSEVVKGKMAVGKTGKLEKPKSEKPKSEKKGLSALQKCQELLAKYTNEKKTAQERIDKRKASGKPAELTPAETISKAAKSVGNKIQDIKDSDKKLTDTEVSKIVSGIESTILNTISAIVEVKNRQKFINELIDYLEKLAINTDEELKNLLGTKYIQFVEILGKNIKDEKFRQALRRIGEKTTVKTSIIGKKAIQMLPTQSEIDVDKSLKRPLQSADDVRMYFTQKTPIKLSGNSVVTCNNGKYIIDGHHRWSQIYIINPQAEVSCLDLTDLKTPFDGLKASQLGIAADLGEVPTKPVKGTNLITISESELKEYVNKHITEDVINVLKEFGVTNPAEFIWNNTKLMQQKNKPVLNAPVRDFMPQTDDAKNWQDYVPNVSKIESTNFRDGGKVEEHNIDMLYNLGTQIKHHSYELMKNIHKNDDVEAWVVSKAQRASTDLSDITHYLEGQKKKFDDGGYVNKMNSVLVKFANPKYNYVTSINGSEDSARKYFIGKNFNVGSFPKEDFQKVIDIEFYPASKRFDNGGELDWGKELSGGFTVGEGIIVIDPSYREFYNKTGYISDEVGSNFEIIVDRNGEDYRLIIPKRSIKRLDMTNLYRHGAMDNGGIL
jgi:L-rhamnose mutarotase